MTTWTEQGKETLSLSTVVRVASHENRVNFEATIPNWISNAKEVNSILTEDSPILVDLLLHYKWGL